MIMKELEILNECHGFQWDEDNVEKNQKTHGVTYLESEEVFFNKPLLFYEDLYHSQTEKRYFVLGRTEIGRKLFIAFTIRNNLIRVISSRDMSKKERQIYEKEEDT